MAVFLCCAAAAGTMHFYSSRPYQAEASSKDYAPTMRMAIVSAENGCTMYKEPGVEPIAQLEKKRDFLSYGKTTLYTELDQEKNFWVLVKKGDMSGYVRADDIEFEKNAGQYALSSDSLYMEVDENESVPAFQSADRAAQTALPEGIYKVEEFVDAKTAQIQSLLDDSVWYVDGRETQFNVDFEEKEVELGEKIVAYAKKFLGTPYVWGGTNLTGGVDCSGFTQSVYAHFGYGLPRTAASQSTVGTPVAMSDLKPGDLLFYVTAMPNPATGQYDEKYPYANPTQEDIQKVLSTMGITVQAGVSRVEAAVSMAGKIEQKARCFR